jgi:hypothetical protein
VPSLGNRWIKVWLVDFLKNGVVWLEGYDNGGSHGTGWDKWGRMGRGGDELGARAVAVDPLAPS